MAAGKNYNSKVPNYAYFTRAQPVLGVSGISSNRVLVNQRLPMVALGGAREACCASVGRAACYQNWKIIIKYASEIITKRGIL